MESDFHDSRLEKEALEWQAKEGRLRKLFGSAPFVENSILREKLRWYENMIAKYKNTSHLEERSMLYLIKSERNNLIKALYPNAVSRIFYKILDAVLLENVRGRNLAVDQSESKKALNSRLAVAGFKNAAEKAERYMALEQAKFTVPVSYYLNEKERMDFSLHFKKDEAGHYQFEGFKAGLHDSSRTDRERSHYFTADEPDIFDSKKAYELLSGRAVQTTGVWKLFDFTDKDAADKYRIKRFPDEYGYDVEKALAQLPLAAEDQTRISSVVHALKDGGREAVVIEKEGLRRNVLIEADPQHKFFTIYDQGLKKVTLSTLFKNKKTSGESVQKKDVAPSVLQAEKNKEQGRTRGRGRSIK